MNWNQNRFTKNIFVKKTDFSAAYTTLLTHLVMVNSKKMSKIVFFKKLTENPPTMAIAELYCICCSICKRKKEFVY